MPCLDMRSLYTDVEPCSQARKVQFDMPAFSQSRSNAAAGGYDARKRGATAGDHHKAGIDALLNPKHAGAQPYRLVLGEVRERSSPV